MKQTLQRLGDRGRGCEMLGKDLFRDDGAWYTLSLAVLEA
jgi:hypothetical protein